MTSPVSAAQVRAWSPFFTSLIEADPGSFDESRDTAQIDQHLLKSRYAEFLSAADTDLATTLRQLRKREMARIIFRDLSGRADLVETTYELSQLAVFCIEAALNHAYAAAVERYGTPRSADGIQQHLVVLAMGKLGANELNLSSDIDLILFYAEPGQTDGHASGKKVVSNQEFFIRVARQLNALLDDSAQVDFVFRVDMRLRPYGDSGPLVLHRAAMEKYYLEQGRDWERYAFIKARFVAGDEREGADFLDWIKPFVFRRHLDFSAIQSLREMKGLIARQVELKESRHDIKLGPGGIREIEFIAQAHQLIWGGRYPALQEPRLLKVLELLGEMELLQAEDVVTLNNAYIFLRNSEHVIQAEYDRQTHLLPESDESRERLSSAMGFDNWESYHHQLEAYRAEVSRCFSELITAPNQATLTLEPGYVEAWANPDDERLQAFKQTVSELHLDDTVAATVDRLMPGLLQIAARSSEPDLALERMLPVVSAILRRSTYVVFLLENLDALEHAIELVVDSTWIAEQLAKYPILLYDLTDRALQQVAVSQMELEADLRELLRTIDPDDVEAQMDSLRQFKLSSMLKIAAMELKDRLSIMQASDGLTALAEVVLAAAIDMAKRHLIARHGEPCDNEGVPLKETFGIIAYGKAGGLELAYGSDLDLTFIGPDNISGVTDGPKSVSNNTFYLRLGQRVVHILTSFTRFGILYSADLRLRPQGNKGPMVATMNALNRYLNNDAWTWEHQALVRARFVAGDRSLGDAFGAIRKAVLSRPRERAQLLGDVMSMREKMRNHLGSPTKEVHESGMDVLTEFDLKHDAGAIVDIEFMVQYAVLGWAQSHPSLTRWTDVMRNLDELAEAGIFDEPEVESLQKAYLAFRAAVHHNWLGLETDYARLNQYRHEVREIWEHRMHGESG